MMKRIVVLSLLLSSLNVSAKTCDVGQFAELEPLADAPFEADLKCLHSLADSPTTPPWSQKLFKTLNGEEVFGGVCALKDIKDYESYVFLSSKGIRALRFPVYHYMMGNDHVSLPGEISHFKVDGKDLFISPQIWEAQIMTKDQILKRANELMMTMSKVYSKIKKYEDYLKSKNLLDSINVTSDSKTIEAVMPCLDRHRSDVIKQYISGKFGPSMPAYATIIGDYNKFDSLDEESRKRYERPFEEFKKDIILDLVTAHPVCQGIIENSKVEAAFESSWGNNKQYYEAIRLRFAPQSQN